MKHYLKSLSAFIIFLSLLIFIPSGYSAELGVHRIGGGIHYWKTIDELKDEYKHFGDDGVSWYVSYQYMYSLIRMELDLEVFPNGYYGSEHTAFAPEVLIGLGSAIYTAIGIGTVYAEPFSA